MKLSFVYLFVYLTTLVYSQETNFLYIWNDTLAFTTDPHFLSYNIDAKILTEWKSYDILFDTRFRTLMRAISPGWLRVGGTQGDHNTFITSSSKNRNDNTYDLSTFQQLCSLAMDFKFNFTFGLNLLQRLGEDWDPTNSEFLMKNIKEMNENNANCRVNFELGNEPDMYFAQGFVVNESQVASAFMTARKAIDVIDFKQRPMLFGPDVASPLYSGYFLDVLKFMPPYGVLDGVTYHHFYDQATMANPEYSYDALVLDKFIELCPLDRATQASKYAQQYQQGAILILGETADYTDDGVDGISNTYLQGFMFLDSLGIASYLKHSIYFKQSLFGTKYSSILNISDQSTADPTPAYWITLLYRKLVSNRVLTVTGNMYKDRYIRMYAHCLNGSTNGSVVVYLMNLNKTEQQIKLSNDPLANSPQHWYLLSYSNPDMNNSEILLNGVKLVLSDNTTLPVMSPDIRPASDSFSFPGRHYGFIVFPLANVKPCKQK